MVDNFFENEMVSVIIPMYNAERFVKETIESVLNQTYKDIEIIIIDDNSTDRSPQIVQELAQQNMQIVYHRFEVNKGVAIARNVAIEMAKGRYIAFLDSDDLWDVNKIEKQLALLKEKQGCFCYTAIQMIDEQGQLLKDKRKVKSVVDYRYLLKNTIISTSSVLLDLKEIGKFEMPDRRRGQDYATWLMLLRRGIVAYGVDEPLVQYRRVQTSLSSKKARNIEDVWHVQRYYEKINVLSVCFNCFCYMVNAVKKYYF